jgi:hypothetical protein
VYIRNAFMTNHNVTPKFNFINEYGRNPDIKIELSSRDFIVECTVLNESTEYQNARQKYLGYHKKSSKVTESISSCHDSNSKGPHWDYDCIRFYQKVYDKLAHHLILEKSQFCSDLPNILCISLNGINTSLSKSKGVSWAIDELFSSFHTRPKYEDGILDTSLEGWLHIYKNELLEEKKLNSNYFKDNYYEIIYAAKKISAIYLFDKYTLMESRINYNAHNANRITHEEAATLDKIMSVEPIWEQ